MDRKICAFGDPFCPCQDGLACHYVDLPGSPAMPPPKPEQYKGKRIPIGLHGGVPGARLWIYKDPAMNEPLNGYAEPECINLLANPILANANGDFPPIYLPEQPYVTFIDIEGER